LVFVGFLVIVGFFLSSFTAAENLPCGITFTGT